MKIILNHKCNFQKEEFIVYQENLCKLQTQHELIVCPSNLYLDLLSPIFQKGAQDVSCYEEGAFTGDVSATQLKAMGVSYTIVGHSERRCYHQETNEEIAMKIKQLRKAHITPILCVGETAGERESGKTLVRLKEELEILKTTENQNEKIIIAYEPIWAIGTGKVPDVKEVDEVLSFIKEKFPQALLLYGGSVNEENITSFKTSKYIDGYLLGGLSLKPEKLQKFLDQIKEN